MKAAVIGVGHLGRHHARILSTLPGISLAGVVDIHQERASQVAIEFGTRSFTDIGEIGGFDLAVIAAPTESHAAIALPLVESGVHVLVEKPVTKTLAEADALIAAARAIRSSASARVEQMGFSTRTSLPASRICRAIRW